MNQRIKKISPQSLGLTFAMIYFIIGVFVGIFGIIAGLFGANATLNGPVTFSGSGGTLIAVSIAYPLLAALMGGIGGILLALIYNLTARYTKGILIHVDQSDPYEL